MFSELFSSQSERLMFVGAIAAAVILVLLLRKRAKPKGFAYDERQALMRGKAYGLALFSLIGWNALYTAVCVVTDRDWFELGLAGVAGILLATGVFGCACILKDAFGRVGDRSVRLIPLLLGLELLNDGLSGAMNLRDGLVVRDGRLTYDACPLFFAGFSLSVLFTFLGKRLAERRHRAEDL